MHVTGTSPVGWKGGGCHHTCTISGKVFAMTTSLMCIVNLQLPCFKVCSWICLHRFVCCVPLLFVCFSFELCSFFFFFFSCDRQPHSRLDMSLQTGRHCNRVGFGLGGRCGCRNLLQDTELVWVLKMLEGWMSSDTMLFSVLCRVLRKSLIVAQVCTEMSTFLDYADVPKTGNCIEHGPCSIFTDSSLGVMGDDNCYHNQSSQSSWKSCSQPAVFLFACCHQWGPTLHPVALHSQKELIACCSPFWFSLWCWAVALISPEWVFSLQRSTSGHCCLFIR